MTETHPGMAQLLPELEKQKHQASLSCMDSVSASLLLTFAPSIQANASMKRRLALAQSEIASLDERLAAVFRACHHGLSQAGRR